MTTRNPFTDYALPPLCSHGIGDDRCLVTTMAIGEESGSGPVVPARPPSALTQVFHVSPPFRGLHAETRDLRVHPQLGGISSTRWQAWNDFLATDPELTNHLWVRPGLPLLRQLIPKPGEPVGPLPSLEIRVETVVGSGARLPASGILSGDERANRLVGSGEADILLGWDGNDRLIGRGGGDILAGGRGADRFVFNFTPSSPAMAWQEDWITDFNGSRGDRLVIRGMTSYRGLQPFSGSAGELRFSPGLLQADLNGDGLADRQIHLPGVRELQPEWLVGAAPDQTPEVGLAA